MLPAEIANAYKNNHKTSEYFEVTLKIDRQWHTDLLLVYFYFLLSSQESYPYMKVTGCLSVCVSVCSEGSYSEPSCCPL